MQPTARLIAFLAGLAAIGGGAAVVGNATDLTPPAGDDRPASAQAGGPGMAMAGPDAAGDGHNDSMAKMAAVVPGSDGTRSSLGGLTLESATPRLPAAEQTTWRFRIVDRDGLTVHHFERDQTKLLHLIVVRDDMTGYQHLHPTMAGDGTFSVGMRVDQPGRYRAIADFTTDHKRYVIGTTLIAPGKTEPQTLPAAATIAQTSGYEVSLKRPAKLVAGTEAGLTFSVTRNGKPVTDLQPYLGAYGHLVALHSPELAYSHVHPSGKNLGRGSISFDAELHKAGPYRLFLQFRTNGRVHTAAFTQLAVKP